MKTAEEVAEEIESKCVGHRMAYAFCKECFDKALTAFAEEASLNTKSIMNIMIRNARAEALEDAAKIVDDQESGRVLRAEGVADYLRSLKDKPRRVTLGGPEGTDVVPA